MDDFHTFDMDAGVPEYKGKVKTTKKDDAFLDFSNIPDTKEDKSGDDDEDMFGNKNFNSIINQQRQNIENIIQSMQQAIDTKTETELALQEAQDNSYVAEISDKQGLQLLKQYGEESDGEFYNEVNRGVYQDFLGEEVGKAEATIHLPPHHTFTCYKHIQSTPDIIKVMVGYYSPFNHYPDSRTKYVSLTITPPSDQKVKGVEYSMNRLNTVASYNCLHKGEYTLQIANPTGSTVVLHIRIVSLQNDLHYITRNTQQKQKQLATQQRVDQMHKEDQELTSLAGDKLHAKQCVNHLKEVHQRLHNMQQLEDHEFYRHEITLRKVSTTAKFYQDIIILETIIIIVLGFLQVKFIANQITTKVLI